MKTYFTVVAWILFLLAALVPVTVAITGKYQADSALAMALLACSGIFSARRAEERKRNQ